ncbi:zinc knuckle CX2CX4HX4C containing protein [Tanacetum coccineum]
MESHGDASKRKGSAGRVNYDDLMARRGEMIVGEDSIRGIANSLSKVIDKMNRSTTNHADQDLIFELIGVSLKTHKDFEDFTRNIELGKFEVSLELSDEKLILYVLSWKLLRLKSLMIVETLKPDQNGSPNHAKFNVSPNYANGQNVIPGQNVSFNVNGQKVNRGNIFTSNVSTGQNVYAGDIPVPIGGTNRPNSDTSIVKSVEINSKLISYAGAAGASNSEQLKSKENFRLMVADKVFEGVNISKPRKVVEKVSVRFKNTLYGYFIGKRMDFLVVEYYARNNWAKHGLKRIMNNAKGFFFFKFDIWAGLKAVLEGGPWMIRKSQNIPKKWSMDTSLLKEELTRIPI